MLRRFASVAAGATLALTSYGVMAAAPAAAGEPIKHKIVVTKVVVGENQGVGYEVVVDCQKVEENGPVDPEALFNGDHNDFPQTLVFPPEGGTQEVEVKVFRSGKECTIVETHNGGATHTTVDPSTCDFPKKEPDLMLPTGPGTHVTGIENGHEGETCEVTVTNTFEAPKPVVGPAGPAGPPGPSGQPAAAVAVRAQARFTG
jgi:hypothetical protein